MSHDYSSHVTSDMNNVDLHTSDPGLDWNQLYSAGLDFEWDQLIVDPDLLYVPDLNNPVETNISNIHTPFTEHDSTTQLSILTEGLESRPISTEISQDSEIPNYGLPGSSRPYRHSWYSESEVSSAGLSTPFEPINDPAPIMEAQNQLRTFSTPTSLPRRKSRYLLSKSQQKTAPIYIPNGSNLDPLQRWQESPPEDEPASMTAIMNAVHSNPTKRNSEDKLANTFINHRGATSITSGESSASSAGSISSAGSRPSRHRQSRSRVTKGKVSDGKPRIFCCTFCCDRFRTRYDWVRHEKSLHLNLETWYCTPEGPRVFSSITGRQHCAYCNALDPSEQHLSEHNYETCRDLPKEERSFRRKDHLVQHLRHAHHMNILPLIDDWQVRVKDIQSRCGICNKTLPNWDERIDHLANHFRKGLSMKDWKGDHGLPVAVQAEVKNAFPPWLIGSESESLVPFSVTTAEARDQYAQLSARAYSGDKVDPSSMGFSEPSTSNENILQFGNFLDIFTRHLSHYAQEQMRNGVIPTDEMFQQESRKLMYDCEDRWNQTIADDPDWLSSFRRLHCDSSKQ